MAHYAVLDSSNIVTGVLTGRDEDDATWPEGYSSWEDYYSQKICGGATVIRTSYNTQNGEHQAGGSAFRGNFACQGMIYDSVKDKFYEPSPYPSWVLNETTWNWDPPIDYPSDYNSVSYEWDEVAYQADSSDPKTAGWVS